MSDTDEELLVTVNTIILICGLLVRRRRARKRTRRFWVRPIWRYRDTEGQAHTLLPRLRARDEGYFRDYLRMPPSVFDTLLGLVRPLIERQVTPFRDPISAHDRLAMTIRFTYADIGHYGGEGDSGIFQRSPLLEVLEKGLLGIPQPRSIGSIGLIPYHMVGDEAFPLKPFMMRPYPRRELQKFRNDPAQRQEYLKRATFNYRLSRARRLIENAFGIMSSRWRILRRPFRASEETTQNIVKSCVVLHNFLLSSPQSRSAYSPPGFTDHEDWEGNIVEGSWRAGSDSLPGMGDLTTMSGYHSA
ncbi:hypothetical protein V5799_002871, partial [Amblyomma americanum]